MRAHPYLSKTLLAAVLLAASSAAFGADGGDWTVSKSSGEVWLTASGIQPAALHHEDTLKPGDTVRTGSNGRVLLKRGEETIMVSPNSVVGIPSEKKEGLSTTILQRAGSILLEVEKRNVKHFEVETPYLAAVVKGTQFRVTINAGKTTVDVIRGQVEVADFKSGQIAQVTAGQHATAFAHGKSGLSLGGSGAFSPIEQGKPRAPSFDRVLVPRNGLSMPRNAANERGAPLSRQANIPSAGNGITRIGSPIGEVRLDVHRATHGLAREKLAAEGGTRRAARNDAALGNSDANSQGNSGSGAASTGGASGISAVIAASSGSDGGGKGNGNGNNGNGIGNGGSNGNAQGIGNGHGNGHAYGRYKEK